VIDSIRTWAVPGLQDFDPDHLGDFYQDVRLYVGGSAASLTPRASAPLSPGSDETDDANITISEATRAGAQLYEDFGAGLRIWQIDFAHLNLAVEGGARYSFGVWGMGRPMSGRDGKTYKWFSHASNASLSGAGRRGWRDAAL
jgi:hypothetical protein